MRKSDLEGANQSLDKKRTQLKRAIKAARSYKEGEEIMKAELKHALAGYYMAQKRAYSLRREYKRAA